MSKTPPKYIYPQWDDECDDEEEITWCTERIADGDVKYVLVCENYDDCPHGYEDHDDCPICRH